MKIAFVHEYLIQFGGAERMLAALSEAFPNAPIYTLMYDERATRGIFKNRQIVTSFLQKFPFAKTQHRLYPLLMPLAVEQFDFSDYDVVLSLSASFAKGVITKPGTRHICYCLTPPRFLWDNSQRFVEDFGFPWIIRRLGLPLISYLRLWDVQAADRPDVFWSISDFVSARIRKYYGRPAQVIYPPVSAGSFRVSDAPSDYFLMVGRLVSYKKFDLAIEAFNILGLPLKIAGTGPEFGRLRRLAGPNVEFLGAVSEQRLAELYSRCRALVFPQEEDFGIVPLEAMASGRPVIAYRAGGALETVAEGKTGVFFDDQTVESLAAAVRTFRPEAYDPQICRAQAEKFDTAVFKKKVIEALGL
ncbi:MAG TPA: glycosyltransferase [Candidatus Paceibacterota bacterium]|nr:glycosyltransferase [Candidatus Paceibacterota bacterium]